MRHKKLSFGLSRLLAVFALTLMTGTWAAAQTEVVLYDFPAATAGAGPFAGLVFDSSGNLYGTTQFGGTYDYGTVFELAPKTGGGWTETVLHSFGADATDGTYPEASLTFDAAGNLYGTTQYGGAYGQGTVFGLAHSARGGWTEKIIHSFNDNGKDGAQPVAGVIFDHAGNIYGTTQVGGVYNYGTVFELEVGAGGSGAEKILHNFNLNGKDGISPLAGLLLDSAGNLYGTTAGGASKENGMVFKLIPTAGGSWKETILINFDGGNGQVPRSGLISDAAGNLYGTTRWGGDGASDGTVYELTPSTGGSWKGSVLHTFGSGTDGQNPEAGLVMDSAGNLYSTTEQGGVYGEGIVFELSPAGGGTWTETVLHNFNYTNFNADGGYPWAGLVLDTAGNLYGTTLDGYPGSGTVYEITP
jgi:uncharacterized repeat protein (TIGR03803 family)